MYLILKSLKIRIYLLHFSYLQNKVSFLLMYHASEDIYLFTQDRFSKERNNLENIGKVSTILRIESC